MRISQNLTKLKQFMVEEWEKILELTLINLVNSMRRRCELVIESDGERILY